MSDITADLRKRCAACPACTAERNNAADEIDRLRAERRVLALIERAHPALVGHARHCIEAEATRGKSAEPSQD